MLIGWLLRLLLLLLVIRALWIFLIGLASGLGARGEGREPLRSRSGSRPPSGGPPAQSVALVRDPVCGMFVEPSHARTMRRGGTTYHFCSDGCLEAFRKAS